MIAVASRGKANTAERYAAELAKLASCAHAATGDRTPSFSTLRDIFVNCGAYLSSTPLVSPTAAFFGMVGVGYGVFDSLRAPLGQSATVMIAEKPRVLEGALTVEGLDRIRLGMTKAEAETASGVPFGFGGPFCDEPLRGGAGVFIEYGRGGQISAVGLEKPR